VFERTDNLTVPIGTAFGRWEEIAVKALVRRAVAKEDARGRARDGRVDEELFDIEPLAVSFVPR
jgi:hypothetical protein